MKISILFSILCLCVICTEAQQSIFVAFQTTYSGRSAVLTGTKTFNQKHELGMGLRYNINQLAHSDDQFYKFKKRLRAKEPIQFLGLEFFYNRYLTNNWENAKPFLFYDTQLTYSQTRNVYYIPILYSEIYGDLYILKIDNYGPFTWMEQCVGFGLKTNITDRFMLYEKIGFGTCFIFGKDIKLAEMNDKFECEFGGIIQVGLLYEFNRNKNK